MKALLLCNPVAARSAGKLRRVVTGILAEALDVDVVETRGSGHATELTADAVRRGCDVVAVLAGDGTANEALQALVGSEVALASLPSGSTNVLARRLGFSRQAPVAARQLVGALRAGSCRRIPLGMANGRWFAFNAGFGIDAAVVRRVDRRPRRKRLLGQAAFIGSAAAILARGYGTPAIEVKTSGAAPSQPFRSVMCASGDPFTYLARLPLGFCPGARPEDGLSLLGLAELRISSLLRTVAAAAGGDVYRLGHTRVWSGLDQATLTSEEPLPLQVDGDDVGDTTAVDLRSVPDVVTFAVPLSRGAGAGAGGRHPTG